jgi:hypothetical protein
LGGCFQYRRIIFRKTQKQVAWTAQQSTNLPRRVVVVHVESVGFAPADRATSPLHRFHSFEVGLRHTEEPSQMLIAILDRVALVRLAVGDETFGTP